VLCLSYPQASGAGVSQRDLHLVMDNYATHKRPEVKAELVANVVLQRGVAVKEDRVLEVRKCQEQGRWDGAPCHGPKRLLRRRCVVNRCRPNLSSGGIQTRSAPKGSTSAIQIGI
jgi:hypothetical protein